MLGHSLFRPFDRSGICRQTDFPGNNITAPTFRSDELLPLAFIMTVLAIVGCEFVTLRLHGGIMGLMLALFFAIFIGHLLHRANSRYRSVFSKNSRSLRFCVITVAAFAVLIVSVYHRGYVLPAYDPIAVPLLAKTVASGHLPIDIFQIGSSAYAYPPGYPILFSPVMRFVPPVDAYFIFKVASLTTILLIPITWTWMQQRLFPIGATSWQVLLAAYLIFFGIERTIGFSVAFAGKNSVLLGILLAPIVVVTAVRQAHSSTGWLLAAIPLFGLVLIHYTMLHLAACLLGGYVLVGLTTKSVTWKDAGRLCLMGILVTGLLLFFLKAALFDPRAGSFHFNPSLGFQHILHVLFTRKSPLTIYSDRDFGIPGFPYRGLVLGACTCISIVISYLIKVPGIRHGACLYSLAFIASLAMAFDVVPSGLAFDFARWFAWALQAAILLQTCIALIKVVQLRAGISRYLSVTGIVVGALTALVLIRIDWQLYKSINESSCLSRRDLLNMQTLLTTASAGQPCFLIGSSRRLPDGLATMQSEKIWEYAESATSCTFINGSWMQPGLVDGRALNGFPSAKDIVSTIHKGVLIFLGDQKTLNTYTEQLSTYGIALKWVQIGGKNTLSAWKSIS